MASTSSSSIQRSFEYDVFLSFRGGDTRNNFVGHLYEALQRNCIETYKDDEKIEKGERLNYQLIKSIEDSKFYIIVFSKNYASSSWCLDELVKIIECQKMTEHTAFPVFYDVEPTELRKQSGAVKDAFATHEKEDAVRTWIEAMKEASNLAGWELKVTANGDESKLIQIIVDVILKKLNSTTSSAGGKLVGMDIRINTVLSSLEISTEDVRMIGIKGIGGGGKTTLARAIYDQISNHFEGKSFVENVREVSKPSLSGLKKLQKRILKDVLNKQDITFSSVHDGKNMLKATMRRRKILLVLDDVDCIEQLEALACELNWFKPGSRIIITTRDEQPLLAHGVNFVHDVNLLSPTEAICLFSRYAFKRDIPTDGYKKLSEQVVCYASGLPLTIKVLGSFLCGKNELEWEDTIERLKTIPLEKTMQILEISYNGLEEYLKEIFLDIACTIKDWFKEDAIIVLESRGFHATIGLKVLEQKSLITYDEDGLLVMHDHLEEMGRNIFRRLNPEEPNKHSQLWIDEEIEDILTNDSGTQAIKCLKLESFDFIAEREMKHLANMNDLQVLDIYIIVAKCNGNSNSINWKFDKVSQYLPSSLRIMRWTGFPFSSLPNTFQGENLVGLEMEDSNIVQLWEDGEGKVLHKLRFLCFDNSKLHTFDLRVAPNLERLTISKCDDFIELHMPAHHLKIKYLDLSLSKLTTLHLGNTPNLETLILEGCNDLVELQMPVANLKLEYLELSHSKLKTIHLGNTPNLETLILKGCNDLVELQMPVENQKLKCLELSHSKLKTIHLGNSPNLETLILEGCNDLVELHMPVENLKLKDLYLSHSKLKTIHLGNTPNLERLVLERCNDFVELQMPVENLNLKCLKLSRSKLKNIHLGNTPILERLAPEGCNDLVELQMPVEILKLDFLDISHSKLKTIHFGNTPNLEMLILEGCNDLVELQMPIENLKLKYLELSHSKLKTIHLGNTPNLETLILEGCNDLVELQMPVENLKLEYLELSHSKLKTIHLGNTPNLETLILEGCNDLVELQMPGENLKLEHLELSHSKFKTIHLGNTPNLERLVLEGCNDLVELQMAVENLKLEYLDLSHSKLKTIHLGNTPNLETLILEGCNDLVELQMPVENLKLEYLELSHSKLKTIHLGNTPNLETLILEGCNDLVELQMPGENLKLEHLELSHSKFKTIHLGNTPNLERLVLEGCNDLVELQMPVENLKLEYLDLSHSKLKTIHLGNTPNLVTLILEGCNDLVELQMPVEYLKLEYLCLSHSQLKTFHLGNTPNLEKLILKGCNDFAELQIPSESPKLIDINLSHSKLRTLDLGLTPNLKWLNLENCYDLVEVTAPIGFLKNLVLLALSGCGRFKSFSFDKQLNLNHSEKQLDTLSELHLIAETIDVCLLHPDDSFPKFRFECYYKEDPASSFGNLEMLISMGLCACTNLENFSRSICSLRGLRKLTLEGSIPEVPWDLDQLECLEELIFSSANIRILPDSICKLTHLKSLRLKSCLHLEKLPEDLGQLECLEELDLIECIYLRHIPSSICQLKSLQYFHLPYCFLVENLPEEIGSLIHLEELNIEGTGISHLPLSIFQLKRLSIVGFTWQLQSYGFKSVIQTSTYVSFAYTSYHSSANHLEKPLFDFARQLHLRRPLTRKQSAHKGL